MKIFPLFLPVLGALAASAAILPDTIGEWKKGEATPAAVADQKVWHEYGLQDSETATYTGAPSGPKSFRASFVVSKRPSTLRLNWLWKSSSVTESSGAN